MTNIAIRVQSLSERYQPCDTPRSPLAGRKESWAVKDVSFGIILVSPLLNRHKLSGN